MPPQVPPIIADVCGANDFTFIRHSQNAVFEFIDAVGHARILRLTHQDHRSVEELESELAWIRHLASQGVPVCVPLGQIVSEDEWRGVVFQKAAGNPVEASDLGDGLAFAHGQALASIHRASLGYPLKDRRQWQDERYFGPDIDAFVPPEWQDIIKERFSVLANQVNEESLHALHFDFGYSNFFLHEGQPQIFDFDNCAMGPRAADIAAALYSSIFTGQRRVPGQGRECFKPPITGENLEQVWRPFRDGYGDWPDSWCPQIETWFHLMFLRSVVHAFRLLHPLSEDAKALLEKDIAHLAVGTMPLNFNFETGRAD